MINFKLVKLNKVFSFKIDQNPLTSLWLRYCQNWISKLAPNIQFKTLIITTKTVDFQRWTLMIKKDGVD